MILIEGKPLFDEKYDILQAQAQERMGFAHLKKLKELAIGSGDTVFKADKNGIWLGAAVFANASFRVTPLGILAATGANIAGTITATAGTIGGWTIGATSLSATAGGNTTILSSGATAFTAGPTGAPAVTITQAGVLTAAGAIISGAITMGAGSTLSGDYITAGIITGRKYRTATTGNARLEIATVGGYASFLTWWNAADSLKSYLVDNGTGTLLVVGTTGIELTADSATIKFYSETGVYNYHNGNLRFASLELVNASYVHFVPSANATLDLGISGIGWRNLYITGSIYGGTTELIDTYSYQTKFLTRMRLWNSNGFPTTNLYVGQMYYYTTDDTVRVRRGDAAWADLCWYDERNDASPIPTFESGLTQLKKIKKATTVNDVLCFDTKAFPKEFIVERRKNAEKHIDLKPIIGMLIKGQKELLEKTIRRLSE